MTYSMDNEARERARKRLEARTARLRDDKPRSSVVERVASARQAFGGDRSTDAPERRARHVRGARPRTVEEGSFDEYEQDDGFFDDEAEADVSAEDAKEPDDAWQEDSNDARGGLDVQDAAKRVADGARTAAAGVASAAKGAVETLGARGLAIAAAIVAVFAILIVGIVQCTAAPPAEEASPEAEQQAEPEKPDTSKIDEAALEAVLGPDVTKKLVDEAQKNADVAWIASNPDKYADDGDVVQRRLLTLAATEPEAVPFVRAFPDKYPQESGEKTDQAPEKGTVPTYYMWDERWGYTVYSSTTFALTGSCPTALSMAYQGLTGNSDGTPFDMGALAERLGYMTEFSGTDAGFLQAAADEMGLACTHPEITADSIESALQSGAVLVFNVGAGDFTDGSSFVVAAGQNDDGTLQIHDPFSATNTAKSWDVQTVIGQTYALYAYTLADASDGAETGEGEDAGPDADGGQDGAGNDNDSV
ncbi:hypothetical protein GMI69_02840 [Eggerthellaceae bacterium zg-887]|uniref:hypothetical protein n=1 Tax=Xiamenia xianingshaonis TaxID=2682776 RepID=UPI001408ADB9|nr:hypothetical protein [Xiamenia xianingshaonis]NHM15611.1 hypothetical protein [Xiamenia xianingshaonis]